MGGIVTASGVGGKVAEGLRDHLQHISLYLLLFLSQEFPVREERSGA